MKKSINCHVELVSESISLLASFECDAGLTLEAKLCCYKQVQGGEAA